MTECDWSCGVGCLSQNNSINTKEEGKMSSINRVFLMGNLTRDPELRKTPSGIVVSDIGLAMNEKYRSKSGELVERVCFADIVVWGRQAETCGQYLVKGSAVMVEGKLQLDQWKTESGEKRSRLRVRADHVQFIGRPHKDATAEAPADGDGIEDEAGGEPATVEKKGGGDDNFPF